MDAGHFSILILAVIFKIKIIDFCIFIVSHLLTSQTSYTSFQS